MPALEMKEDYDFSTAINFAEHFKLEKIFEELFEAPIDEFMYDGEDDGEMICSMIEKAFPEWTYTLWFNEGKQYGGGDGYYTVRIFE